MNGIVIMVNEAWDGVGFVAEANNAETGELVAWGAGLTAVDALTVLESRLATIGLGRAA